METPEIKTPHPGQLGGKTGKRGGRADLPVRLDRYGNAKSHTQRLIREIGPERAAVAGMKFKPIEDCGGWLWFRDYYEKGQLKLHAANFCGNSLVCSFCAIRRGARNLSSYLERLKTIYEGFAESGITNPPKPYLVTLTVRNGPDLEERLEHLLKSLRLLHKRRHNSRQKSVLNDVAGGVFSIELTYNEETKTWHPHVHAIWLADQFPNQHALRAEWEQITGDSFMCDVREIRNYADTPAESDGYAGGFAEVFKYAVKASSLGAERMLEAYPVLKGRRLIGAFGLFFGVPMSTSLADDETGLDLEVFEDIFMRFNGRGYDRVQTKQDAALPMEGPSS